MGWSNSGPLSALQFRCGYCGKDVANDRGYNSGDGTNNRRIYICPGCDCPTYLEKTAYGFNQTPGVPEGNQVSHLPKELGALYEEARRCCSVNAYTSSVLACRKLLMNIAVAQGAKPGLAFIEYVDYLSKNGFVPPNGKGWTDHIRKKGNEATHEIHPMDRDTAKELLSFVEMLLKFIYEFPARIAPPPPPP